MKSVLKSPLPRETYVKNAAIYKLLSNPKRLEVLNILKTGEHSVEQLLQIIKISKANMSQHLAVLRRSGIVTTRRDGLNIFYTILSPDIISPCTVLQDLRKKKLIK